MVSQVSKPDQPIVTNTWVAIDWAEFIQIIDRPEFQDCKAYYHNQKMRLETMPVGFTHGKKQAILIFVLGLYAMLQDLPVTPTDNVSFRKTGFDEFQPDVAYYVGAQANVIPENTRVVDLDQYPLPHLVIEVADTTLQDDLGEKRLQYEELGISEYWVWDVSAGRIFAFAIGPDRSSRHIRTSAVFAGLDFDLLEAGLERSRTDGQSAAGQWLMQQWSR